MAGGGPRDGYTFLTVREAAQALGLAEVTIRRQCAAGRLPAHRTEGGKWLIDSRLLDRRET